MIFHFHKPLHNAREIAQLSAKQLRARRIRFAIFALASSLLLVILLVEFARAGGPQYVAGVSYFNSGLAGQPLTWPGGSVHYYTDQGDLSAVLRGQDADAFVADAFSRWTLISTAAVSATHAGHLAENGSGSNVILNSDRTVTMPADVLPGSLAPVEIIYDEDGAVTDALLGAGSSSECFGKCRNRRPRCLHGRRSYRTRARHSRWPVRADVVRFARTAIPSDAGSRPGLRTRLVAAKSECPHWRPLPDVRREGRLSPHARARFHQLRAD